MSSNDPTPTPTTLTLAEIRGLLTEEIQRLRSGESTPAQANAVTNAAGKVLSSVKLELEYLRLTGRRVMVPMLEDGTDGRPGDLAEAADRG